jgi:hypothetical protein
MEGTGDADDADAPPTSEDGGADAGFHDPAERRAPHSGMRGAAPRALTARAPGAARPGQKKV